VTSTPCEAINICSAYVCMYVLCMYVCMYVCTR